LCRRIVRTKLRGNCVTGGVVTDWVNSDCVSAPVHDIRDGSFFSDSRVVGDENVIELPHESRITKLDKDFGRRTVGRAGHQESAGGFSYRLLHF
jgi:hypothetical protein